MSMEQPQQSQVLGYNAMPHVSVWSVALGRRRNTQHVLSNVK